MRDFEYVATTTKNFDEAVRAVEAATAARSFRVLHTHDVAATLAEKGLQRGPLKILEICNARYAHEVLQKDVLTALMLPCPIMVYEQEGVTHIATMRPAVMKQFYAGKGIDAIADQVELAALAIVDEAAA